MDGSIDEWRTYVPRANKWWRSYRWMDGNVLVDGHVLDHGRFMVAVGYICSAMEVVLYVTAHTVGPVWCVRRNNGCPTTPSRQRKMNLHCRVLCYGPCPLHCSRGKPKILHAACCELRTSGKAQPRLNPTWVERIKVVAHRCPDLRYIMKYVAWTYLSEETPDTHNHASLELISVSLG
jgi:hypothetical protein